MPGSACRVNGLFPGAMVAGQVMLWHQVRASALSPRRTLLPMRTSRGIKPKAPRSANPSGGLALFQLRASLGGKMTR